MIKNNKTVKMNYTSRKDVYRQPKLVMPLMILLAMIGSVALGARDKTRAIDEYLNGQLQSGRFNGVALVAERGRVILEKGYGLANMEWKIPNDPETRFQIGSLGKSFVAMSIMMLVEDGKIDLTAPVSRYVPKLRPEIADRITIHHLLTHSSGLPWTVDYNRFAASPADLDETVRMVCSGDLEFTPGSRYKYSSSGYFLLMAVVEKVSGIPYTQFLRQRILTPLGMTQTQFDSDGLIDKRASGYRFRGGRYVNVTLSNPGNWQVASSPILTTHDLFLWDQALYGENLVPRRVLDQILAKQVQTGTDDNGDKAFYGYGWVIKELTQNGRTVRRIVRHGGGDIGFAAWMVRFVDDRSTIILLTNALGDQSHVEPIAAEIEKFLYDAPTPSTPVDSADSYLGQKPPRETPELFAPGIVSTGAHEHSSPVFTPDGLEIYWSTVIMEKGKTVSRPTLFMKRHNGGWTKPRIPDFAQGLMTCENPFISPDGQQIFFAVGNSLVPDRFVQYYAQRQGEGWSQPIRIPEPINTSSSNVCEATVARDKTLFYVEYLPEAQIKFEIKNAQWINGVYTQPRLMGGGANSGRINWTPYVAPDQTYLIFSSSREGEFGNGDLYICFRQADSTWGKAINMGSTINTQEQERFPNVSPDGNYLFFNRAQKIPGAGPDDPGNGKGDVYWVSTTVIEDLRKEALKDDK